MNSASTWVNEQEHSSTHFFKASRSPGPSSARDTWTYYYAPTWMCQSERSCQLASGACCARNDLGADGGYVTRGARGAGLWRSGSRDARAEPRTEADRVCLLLLR